MIDGHMVLGVIPARGGSKGIPGKNIRILHGKPLIAWTIEEGRQSVYLDRLIVTSDDSSIIAVSKQYGAEVPFVRPAELSRDDTPGIEPVLHALNELPGYDYVVLLQPTSPLRRATDIDGCIERCIQTGANACVSVMEAEQNPYWMYTLDAAGTMQSVLDDAFNYLRRQELPVVYALNGAVYVANVEWLRHNRSFIGEGVQGYAMSREYSVDIDTELDLQRAALLLELRNRAQ